MSQRASRVCPVERAGSLDNGLRRWLQNPWKILRPYIEEGMTAADIGCGPGFFSMEMARMVGATGRVFACDVQQGMLDNIRDKISGTALEERIILHRCGENTIGLSESVDFILLFYMVHEVQNKADFFVELATILRPGGTVLIAEPPIHVSTSAFNRTVDMARDVGFVDSKGPHLLLSKTVILNKG